MEDLKEMIAKQKTGKKKRDKVEVPNDLHVSFDISSDYHWVYTYDAENSEIAVLKVPSFSDFDIFLCIFDLSSNVVKCRVLRISK